MTQAGGKWSANCHFLFQTQATQISVNQSYLNGIKLTEIITLANSGGKPLKLLWTGNYGQQKKQDFTWKLTPKLGSMLTVNWRLVPPTWTLYCVRINFHDDNTNQGIKIVIYSVTIYSLRHLLELSWDWRRLQGQVFITKVTFILQNRRQKSIQCWSILCELKNFLHSSSWVYDAVLQVIELYICKFRGLFFCRCFKFCFSFFHQLLKRAPCSTACHSLHKSSVLPNLRDTSAKPE